MAYQYNLTLTHKETGDQVSLSGEFESGNWERLIEFAQYADELLRTKFVQDGMPASLNIRWDESSGMAVTAKLPPWDDVIVFLHKFRPIGLQSERTYYYNICNILTKEIADPHFRSMIDEQRDIYSGKRMRAQFQVQSDEVILNSEQVLYDWLNAYEYHRSKEKREFVDALHNFLPLEASKVLFLALLTDKTVAIHNVYS